MSGQIENSNPEPEYKEPKRVNKANIDTLLPGLGIVLVLAITAYQPVIFDFFLSDDFVHLLWLKKAMLNPELIARNFSHNWLDITTTSFYRPLISVFMASDYYFGGANGLGFHITNLFFHLVATVAIYFLSRGLYIDASNFYDDSDETTVNNASLYGLFASTIFALYPLHSEAVAWITGRVDAVVTAFICLSLLFYRQWRKHGTRVHLVRAIIFMIAALLSKEMAITLPAIFFTYSLILEKNSQNFVGRILQALKNSAPFFLLLAFYFVVRRLALGTFVGGYDNSVFLSSDLRHFVETWIHGLRMFLNPVNREIVSSSSPFTIVWFIILAICLVLFLQNLFSKKSIARLNLFNFSFLFFAFLPVYKLFSIANDLQGSRLAHVATVAFSLIAASSFLYDGNKNRLLKYAKLFTAVAYSVVLFAGLRINNLVWAKAGEVVNSIREELASEYKKIKGDPQVLLLNLPDNIHGAYAMRNALDGITKTPQFPRDIHNCLMISGFESIIPFGFLKNSIKENFDDIIILNWSAIKKSFQRISISLDQDAISKEIEQNQKTLTKEFTIETQKLPCFDFEVLKVTCEPATARPEDKINEAVLYYSNSLYPQISNQKSILSSYDKDSKSFFFPLYSRPDWVFGGKSNILKLKLIDDASFALKRIEILKKQDLMPKLSFENSGYTGSKGFIHLSKQDPHKIVFVDGTNLPGAHAIRFVIAMPNQYFERQNPPTEKATLFKTIDADINGKIELKRELFGADGIYQARAWCLDEKGEDMGLASDHVVISVDD